MTSGRNDIPKQLEREFLDSLLMPGVEMVVDLFGKGHNNSVIGVVGRVTKREKHEFVYNVFFDIKTFELDGSRISSLAQRYLLSASEAHCVGEDGVLLKGNAHFYNVKENIMHGAIRDIRIVGELSPNYGLDVMLGMGNWNC